MVLDQDKNNTDTIALKLKDKLYQHSIFVYITNY